MNNNRALSTSIDTNCEHDTHCASAVQITYFIMKTRFFMSLKNIKSMTLNASLTRIVQKHDTKYNMTLHVNMTRIAGTTVEPDMIQ